MQAKQVQELSFVHKKWLKKIAKFGSVIGDVANKQILNRVRKKRLFLGAGFYGVLILLAATESLSWLLVGWYVVLGIITDMMYAKDKTAAQRDDWRTPESTLHLLSVLGGWVGALVAQTYLRHKSQKPEFRLMYYLTVVINLAGLLFIISGNETDFLGKWLLFGMP